jgi:transglutaminase-like putative cysteine protease
MNLKSFILSSFALFFLIQINAQIPEFKWGKISDAEQKMTYYPGDPNAPAVVLAKLGLVYFNLSGQDLRVVIERYRRVKIFNKSAFNLGQVSISYQYKDKYDIITDLKAQIIFPDGKKRLLERSDYIDEQIDGNNATIRFNFPDIKEGCILEYRYIKSSKYYYRLPNWYFQEDIPVAWSILNLKIPEYFEYVVNQIGQKPQIEETYDPIESFDPIKNNPVSISNYLLAAHDLPGITPQPFITTMDDYLSHVTFQLTGTMNSKGVMNTYWPTWKKLANLMTEHESFGKKYKSPEKYSIPFDSIVNKINALPTPLEKIKGVYDFVRQHIAWDGTNDIWAYKDLNEAFLRKKGSSAEINLLVVALLKSFGLPAYPMLISTRDNGQPFDTHPIVEQFNYVVGVITVEGKDYYLDATSPFRMMGLLGKNAINTMGWAVHPTDPMWKKIIPDTARSTRTFTMHLADKGTLKGQLSATYRSYSAVDVRQELFGGANTVFENQTPEDVTAQVSYVKYDSVKVANGQDVYKPLLYDAQVAIPEWAETRDSLLFVNPVIQPIFESNPLTQVIRKYPVNIPYPLVNNYLFTFSIPDGYVIEHLPDTLNIVLPKDAGKYDYTAVQKGNTIQVSINTEIKQINYPVDDYQSIKNFFFLLTEKQTEYIVLKKKKTSKK